MEERRGESIDETMAKVGPRYITTKDAYEAAAIACDAEGIDPSLELSERVARMQDIHQGSPLMHEERQRKAAYEGSRAPKE